MVQKPILCNIVHVSRYVVFEEMKTWSWKQQEEIKSSQLNSFTIFNAHTTEEEPVTPRSMNSTTDGDSLATTPPLHSDTKISESENSDSSIEPKNYKSINDIYNNREEVELEDELLLMGVDEHTNYSQAVKELD